MNKFTIKARLPSLNDYINACRTCWADGAKFKRETEELIVWTIRSAMHMGHCRPASGTVVIAFLWHEYSRRRDADNIYSAKKYILDAMQAAGIIERDSRRYVLDCVDLGIVPAKKGQDKVEVELMEVSADEWDKYGRSAIYDRLAGRFGFAGGDPLRDKEMRGGRGGRADI